MRYAFPGRNDQNKKGKQDSGIIDYHLRLSLAVFLCFEDIMKFYNSFIIYYLKRSQYQKERTLFLFFLP